MCNLCMEVGWMIIIVPLQYVFCARLICFDNTIISLETMVADVTLNVH